MTSSGNIFSLRPAKQYSGTESDDMSSGRNSISMLDVDSSECNHSDVSHFDLEYAGGAETPPSSWSSKWTSAGEKGGLFGGFVYQDKATAKAYILQRPRRRFARTSYIVSLLTFLTIVTWLVTATPLFRNTIGTNASADFPTNEVPLWDPELPSTSSWPWRFAAAPRYEPKKDIPNIAHFVRQVNRYPNGAAKPFRVEFRHLMSYYSCYMFLRPEAIYFWTDAPPSTLEEARLHGDKFTKALFRIPNLHIRPATFPSTTMRGVTIKLYAHKSDFVRTRIMAKMGGMYFDDDAWVLRDLAPLRKAGFDNVFSLDEGARIAQACWLSKPRNPLMIAFARLQEIVFNGDWLRASNDLVTALMVHYARTPGDRTSLVLEKDAFFPGYWIGDALNEYYEVHDDDVATFEEMPAPRPTDDITQAFQFDKQWGWRRDWRRTWVIHGFSNELRARKGDWMFKEFKWFSPAYVLSRRSNIGRALYPALRDMLDSGFLELTDDDMRIQPA